MAAVWAEEPERAGTVWVRPCLPWVSSHTHLPSRPAMIRLLFSPFELALTVATLTVALPICAVSLTVTQALVSVVAVGFPR